MTWNTDITSAPRDAELWLATKCGKVIKTHWHDKFGSGRWVGLATREEPVAWQMFVVPDHPFASIGGGEPQAQSPVLADRANAGGSHVTDGEKAQPDSAGGRVVSSPDLIVHRHVFLDDVGGEV
jgi:hypothetical protein